MKKQNKYCNIKFFYKNGVYIILCYYLFIKCHYCPVKVDK